MDGCILAFGLTETELKKLRALCEITELRLTAVEESEYGSVLGAFIGLLPPNPPAPHDPLPAKMLVFGFVPDAMLQYVLNRLRAEDIASGSYKAVLTPNNVFMTVPELFEELRREREELGDH